MTEETGKGELPGEPVARKKYRVEFWGDVEVEAESEDEAVEKACHAVEMAIGAHLFCYLEPAEDDKDDEDEDEVSAAQAEERVP